MKVLDNHVRFAGFVCIVYTFVPFFYLAEYSLLILRAGLLSELFPDLRSGKAANSCLFCWLVFPVLVQCSNDDSRRGTLKVIE